MEGWEQRGTLVVALVALFFSLVGTSLVWRQAQRNKDTSENAQRGLTCLLQRAEQTVIDLPSTTLRQVERKEKALAFYEREIRLAGGRRPDCLLKS